MRTYYQDEHVHITSEHVRVAAENIERGEYVYSLSHVDQTWRRTGSLAVRRILLGLAVLACALLVRAATSVVWWFRQLPDLVRRWLAHGVTTMAIATAGVLVVAGVGVVAIEWTIRAVEDIRNHIRYRELWIRTDGRDVMLVRTTDTARFEKICRALARALGDQDLPG